MPLGPAADAAAAAAAAVGDAAALPPQLLPARPAALAALQASASRSSLAAAAPHCTCSVPSPRGRPSVHVLVGRWRGAGRVASVRLVCQQLWRKACTRPAHGAGCPRHVCGHAQLAGRLPLLTLLVPVIRCTRQGLHAREHGSSTPCTLHACSPCTSSRPWVAASRPVCTAQGGGSRFGVHGLHMLGSPTATTRHISAAATDSCSGLSCYATTLTCRCRPAQSPPLPGASWASLQACARPCTQGSLCVDVHRLSSTVKLGNQLCRTLLAAGRRRATCARPPRPPA
jgi:hypothetical protein